MSRTISRSDTRLWRLQDVDDLFSSKNVGRTRVGGTYARENDYKYVREDLCTALIIRTVRRAPARVKSIARAVQKKKTSLISRASCGRINK